MRFLEQALEVTTDPVEEAQLHATAGSTALNALLIDEAVGQLDGNASAQLVMEAAARRLNDAPAWFGYCGDKKAAIVDARVGYVPTRHRYLIVNWFQTLPSSEQERLIDKIAGIAPF